MPSWRRKWPPCRDPQVVTSIGASIVKLAAASSYAAKPVQPAAVSTQKPVMPTTQAQDVANNLRGVHELGYDSREGFGRPDLNATKMNINGGKTAMITKTGQELLVKEAVNLAGVKNFGATIAGKIKNLFGKKAPKQQGTIQGNMRQVRSSGPYGFTTTVEEAPRQYLPAVVQNNGVAGVRATSNAGSASNARAASNAGSAEESVNPTALEKARGYISKPFEFVGNGMGGLGYLGRSGAIGFRENGWNGLTSEIGTAWRNLGLAGQQTATATVGGAGLLGAGYLALGGNSKPAYTNYGYPQQFSGYPRQFNGSWQ